jgi:predicted MPP superfamily phosphohydrolase
MPWSREIGIIIFLIVIPVLLLSLQYFLYRKLLRWMKEHLRAPRWAQRTLAGLFLLFGIAFIVVMVLRPDVRKFPEWFQVTGMYPFLLWHSSAFLLAFLFGLWALISGAIRLAIRLVRRLRPLRKHVDALAATPEYRKFDASRRVFLRRSAYGLAAMTVGGTAYGMIIGRNEYEIITKEIPIAGLPNEFDGMVIGLISDVHSGAFMLPSKMREYLKMVNDLGADLVTIPGDLVNGRVEEIFAFTEVFSELKAPLGVYGVLGNHDFYSGDPDRVAEEATKAGIRILRDESVPITRNGATIILAGVDDVGHNNRAPIKLEKALAAAPGNTSVLLLSHRPYYLSQAAARGVGLTLSGHTHGGQVVFGKFGNAVLTPAAFASPYVWGLYSSGKSQMYVTRGIGTVGLPMRINCPAEVSRIVLRAA